MAPVFLRALACAELVRQAARLPEGSGGIPQARGVANTPLETLHIPFEGSSIVAYRQLPAAAAKEKVPIVVAISGADSRKEDIAERFAAVLPHGAGYVALESPGTGETPLKISPTADRMFSTMIDFVCRMPQTDPDRLLLYGGSFGGYWAAKLAVTERERLRAVVVQSPPVHAVFDEEFLRTQTLTNREYLFDLGPALMFMCENARTVDDLAASFGELSLVRQGIIGRPTTRMLVIRGIRDAQVPMSDIELLLCSGDVPKEAWINPSGGHMGRELKGWTDPVIFRDVTCRGSFAPRSNRVSKRQAHNRPSRAQWLSG